MWRRLADRALVGHRGVRLSGGQVQRTGVELREALRRRGVTAVGPWEHLAGEWGHLAG